MRRPRDKWKLNFQELRFSDHVTSHGRRTPSGASRWYLENTVGGLSQFAGVGWSLGHTHIHRTVRDGVDKRPFALEMRCSPVRKKPRYLNA